MNDYHCHLLPGFDDGAANRDEALAMARALVEFGFSAVFCTPHCIKGQYEFSPVEVRDAVRTLQGVIDGAGIPLVLHPGMEYYLDGCFESFAANLLPLGNSRLVLCEIPPQVLPGVASAMLELIVVQGFVPLVAHPERSESVYRMLTAEAAGGDRLPVPQDEARRIESARSRSLFSRLFPSTLAPLSGRGIEIRDGTLPETCRFQANLGSFTGFYGDVAQRRAYELLQRGAYHCFASDLHDVRTAPVVLEPAREKLDHNPALRKLSAFVAQQGTAGSPQMAFW